MPKSLALFDIDNTMCEGFVYLELIAQQVQQKIVHPKTLDDINGSMERYKLGRQSYEETALEVLKAHAVGLKGVNWDIVLEATVDFYQQSTKFFEYVTPTIQELRLTHKVVIVTAQPQFCAQAVGKRFGIRSYCSSEFEIKDGEFTGSIVRQLASRYGKHNAIAQLIKNYDTRHSFAFGDSGGDIEMLGAVEYPICLNPTEELRSIAREKAWYMPELREVPALVARLNQGLNL
jgi:putative phosphoserine phosphatase / 1-acylglycerol-3-phosphate O-acyltransferase